jgi:hypothetical protein
MRSPKRRLPGRPATIRCFFAAMTILGSIATARAADNGKTLPAIPDVGEPFDVKKFRAVSVPYGQNAFVAYRHATGSMVRAYDILSRTAPGGIVKWDPYLKSLDEALDKGWKFANDDVRQWVTENETALAAWSRGTECASASDRTPGPLGADESLGLTISSRGQRLPEPMREFARLACLKAAQLDANGRPADAWIWYRAVLRSGSHLSMETALIGRLAGYAINDLAYSGIRRWAAQPQVGAGELRRALADAIAVNAMLPPPSEALKGEYFCWIDAGDRESVITVAIPQLGDYLPYVGYEERARRTLNLVYANLLSQADRPRWRRTPNRGELGLFGRGSGASGAPGVYADGIYSDEEIEQRILAFRPDREIAKILLPPKTLFDVFDRERTQQSALVLGLALQLHAREHGEFPASLDELVRNGYLKAIPPDPFGKGEPFRYRCELNRQDAVLWSVGMDGIDQQGKIDAWRNTRHRTGDEIFKIHAPRRGS